jgi:hypothetical protein
VQHFPGDDFALVIDDGVINARGPALSMTSPHAALLLMSLPDGSLHHLHAGR